MKKLDAKMERAELEKACCRVLAGTHPVIDWLLAFGREQEEGLSVGERLNRLYELRAFIYFQLGTAHTKFGGIKLEGLLQQDKTCGLTNEDVNIIRSGVQLLLRDAAAGRHLVFPGLHIHQLEIMPILTRKDHPKDPHKNRVFVTGQVVPHAESIAEVFIWNFAHLLATNFGRVKPCPECETLFIRDRRNQAFCGPPCRSRVATRRHRGIPDDRKGKRGRPIGSSPKPLTRKRSKKEGT